MKQGILEQVTGRADWEPMDGPETGCGVDRWFRSGGGDEAWVNDDQGYLTIAINGETVYEGLPEDQEEED